SMDELRDVMDNDIPGQREISIHLKEKAYLLGLSRREVARQIRQGYFGDETQRIQRGEDEVRIWVRYSLDDRSMVSKLDNMRIRMANGNEFPLAEIVDYEIIRRPAVINHMDGKRMIKVDADLADPSQDVPPVLAKINKNIVGPLLLEYPTVKTVEEGQKRELNKTMTSSMRVLPVALFGMLIIIILGFRSVWQTLLVILLIPLGFIGASWGHWMHDMPVSLMSYYGIIALLGIIVNDSIVFVNAFNINIKQGLPFMKAVEEAGISRFRPVILTTVTTIFGLGPLIFEKSFQAQFLVPMAVSIAYGLLFTSIMIVILLPVMIVLLNKARIYLQWLWTGVKPSPEEVEPAYREMKRLQSLEHNEEK
ncbi:efflux RND transporter permease subunit, partial [Bacteroidota bacterium]